MLDGIRFRADRMVDGDPSCLGSDEAEVGMGRRKRQIYHWGGRIHNVPENFEIPKMTLGALITVWFCGDRRQRIPPLKYIQGYDLPTRKNAKVVISQMRKMIMYVRKAAEVVGFSIPRDSNDMTEADTVALYAAVKELFKYKSLRVNFRRRFEGILWKTVFNMVSQHKGKFADEVNLLIEQQARRQQ